MGSPCHPPHPNTPKRVHNRGKNPRARRASAALRAAVIERDGFRCAKCGDRDRLEIDHVVPWSRGGRTVLGNLQILCWLCNGQKGARTDG